MTKVLNKSEIPNGEENLTIKQAGEQIELVKAAVLSTLAAAKGDEIGDLIFESHNDLLPELFEGWISSESCATLAPHLRAAFFSRYTALQQLLFDLDQVLDRLPSEILKSIA